ncbi:MAG TPA: carboxypeptidase-like regulatory domain-containing protein, partial [Bacteroidota bacterium]
MLTYHRFIGKKMLSFIAPLFLLVVVVPLTVFGQGVVQGVVTDSLDNTVLIGANVFLVGTSLGNATDREGKFRITAIPAGAYTLRVSYLGYRSKDFEITVGAEEVMVNASLAPEILQAGEVLVTAQARGQVAAINQQVTANTIMSVVSEEKIQELPDANAAEAIGRLPGVSIIRSGGEASRVVLRGLSSKFSNITVDGVKIPPTDPNTRDVDLSSLSQGSLAGIELYKVLRADMDADAIAGAINLVTRRAPAERLLRFDLKGDYNHLMQSANQYDLSFRYGERFFGSLLGIQLQGNLEKKIRSRENSNINYTYFDSDSATKNFKDYFITNFFLTFTDETRKREGAGVIFDVNTPDSGFVKLNTLYGSTGRDYTVYTRNYPVNVSSINYSAQNVEQDISTFNSSLQGKNFLLGFVVNWSLSYAESRIDNPYDFFINFLEDSKTDAGMKPGAPLLRDQPELLIPYAWNNYSAATCSTGVFNTQNNFDKERTISLDVTKHYTLLGFLSGEFKLGGKQKERNRWLTGTQSAAAYWVGYFRRYNIDGSEKALLGTTFDRFYQLYLSSGG